jgi:hypothetical protein
MRRLSHFPWYTLLVAAYSPLALIAYNTGQVAFNAVIRSLLIIVTAVLVLTALMMFLLRDVHKVGLTVTVALVLFFSYGHVYELAASTTFFGIPVGRHRYLLGLYLLILAGTVLWVVRSRSSFKQWSSALMTFALVALFFPVYRLAAYQLEAGRPAGAAAATQSPGGTASTTEKLPDIYYIILDTYGRTDFLRDHAGYDNSQFIDSLQDLGFYVAQCSQSNYAQTGLSLASSLNFDYIETLGLDFSAEEFKREDVVAPYIKHSAVVERLREIGYRIVAFETGYDFTTLDDTDILYPAPQSGISDFELVLLRSTVLVLLDDAGVFEEIYPTAVENRRAMILYQLRTLEGLPSVSGPKFVFAHFLIPHFPYVFDADGSSLIGTSLTQPEGNLTTQEYFEGFRRQTMFTSDQILKIASELIRNSDLAPIIIIQGDHGPNRAGEAARMGILNAYFFPGNQTPSLYNDISPVNTFRVLFNTYFGTQFDLLPDISYFSRQNSPGDTTVIPNECEFQR